MYEVEGIVYADEPRGEIGVSAVKPLGDLTMLVTFATGETRLFDAAPLLEKPAFAPLADEGVFMRPEVDCGVVAWDGGELDVSPAYLYHHSSAYAGTA